MKFCEQCGLEVKPGANFCQKCGFKLSHEKHPESVNANIKITHTNATTEKLLKGVGNSISTTTSNAESLYNSTKPKLKKLFRLTISVIIGGALLALACFSAYYYYNNIYFPAITEFRDIKLSHKKEDVLNIKGEPD